MKSIFLKLSSFWFGAARRHCPFTSIIHKPISFLFAVIFFSLHCFLVPVSALAQPSFQPVIDTQFYQLPQFVDPLTDPQLDIFYFILGSQLVEYAGLSGYKLDNPYTEPESVGEWFKKIGIDLYNDVLGSFVAVGAPIVAGGKWLKDLYANIAGAANFAGYFNNTSFQDFLNDVDENGLSLELYPSMFGALNQFLANKGGLYDWQVSTSPFITNLEWNISYLNQNQINDYMSWVNNNPYNVRINNNIATFTNDRFGSNLFNVYHNLFIDSGNHSINICDDFGNFISGVHYLNEIWYVTSNSQLNSGVDRSFGFVSATYDPLQYNSYIDIANDFFNNKWKLNSKIVFYDDFINHVYVGTSWNSKTELFNNTDLNFDDNPSQDVLVPINNTLLDIKGLIQDLLETNDLRAPAIDNLTLPDGSPLPAAQLQPISIAVDLPESGIVIPEGLFGSSKGFIDYLWFMTKPLVQYTHDFLGTMWFDGVDGFDFSGPAPIVFGVITLGLIGGLIVKFLL